MKLQATSGMRNAHDELVKEGRISQTAYDYAMSMGFSDADLIRAADNVAQRRARMRYKSDAWLHRSDRKALTNPNDPTPEWKQRAGKMLTTKTVGKGEVVPLKSFRVRTLIEQYEALLGEERVEVLKRYEADASHAQRCRIANWQPSGGGSIHKFGGLGNVHDYVRKAEARHAWVNRRLSEESRSVARALVTGEVRKVSGEPFAPTEFAGRIYPEVNHTHRKWGLSMGALWALTGQLALAYSLCPIHVPVVSELDVELMEG